MGCFQKKIEPHGPLEWGLLLIQNVLKILNSGNNEAIRALLSGIEALLVIIRAKQPLKDKGNPTGGQK